MGDEMNTNGPCPVCGANAAAAGRSVLVGYTGTCRHIQADADTTLCGRVDGHRGSWFIRADGDEPLCQACEARQ